MKIILQFILTVAAVSMPAWAYNDHRGHNLDSLERTVAPWTPDAIDKASEEELVGLNNAYRELMLGYNNINAEKSLFYARKALAISLRQDWVFANADACRYIGQYCWAKEQYDSALVYFEKGLENIERMEVGATSPTRPDGYTQEDIDDMRSAQYGAIGNLYNMMGDIPRAMDYYAKAGAIFDEYGWNTSNSILYYNIGETWLDEGDLKEAEKAYFKSLEYATEARDSLWVAVSKKGLGRLFMTRGKTAKAIRYLHEADEYFSVHDKEEAISRKENFEYMSLALEAQKKTLSLLAAALAAVILLFAAAVILSVTLRRSKRIQTETAEIMEETLKEMKPVTVGDVQLSEREKEILKLLSNGYTTPDIAAALRLSSETIRWYRKKLLAKLEASNTAELISIAKETGLV